MERDALAELIEQVSQGDQRAKSLAAHLFGALAIALVNAGAVSRDRLAAELRSLAQSYPDETTPTHRNEAQEILAIVANGLKTQPTKEPARKSARGKLRIIQGEKWEAPAE